MILLVQYTLLYAAVLTLVALGGCYSEHSGVINLGLEGIMVMGAMGGAFAMKFLTAAGVTSPLTIIVTVIVVSMAIGILYSLLLAVASVTFKADQTIVGTALNLLGTAAATVIVKAVNTSATIDNVSSGMVTYAVRNAKVDGFSLTKGDIIALDNKKILAKGKDLSKVTGDLIEKLRYNAHSLVNLYYGSDVTEEEAAALQATLAARYPELDVELFYGGQPIYYYIVSLE